MGEIEWDNKDASDTILFSGPAGTLDICLPDGPYTFNGYDDYGDGWNGATAVLTDEVIFSMDTGSSGSTTFDCVSGSCVAVGCDFTAYIVLYTQGQGSWEEAQTSCENMGYNLAIVESNENQAALENVLSQYDN